MSIDRRVREALHRSAELADEDRDLAGPLASVERRGRRARSVRHAVTVGVVVASLALVALVGPSILRGFKNEQPATSITPVDPYAEVLGTYTVTLSSRTSLVSQTGTTGTWVIQLRGNQAMTLLAPSSFASAPVYATYSLDGGTFSTDAFQGQPGCTASAGSYGWTRSSSGLTLVPVADDCDIRRAIFGTVPLTDRTPSAVDGIWKTHTVSALRQSSEIRGAGFSQNDVATFLSDQHESASIVYTLRLEDGIYQTLASADGGPTKAIDTGSYSVRGSTITIRPFGGGNAVWRFSLTGDRLDLQLIRDTQAGYKGMSDAVFQHGIYTSAPFFRSF